MKNERMETARRQYPLWILGAVCLLSAGSWLGSVYGLPVRNVLSMEGMRWCVANVDANFHASYADRTVLLLLSAGMCQESGVTACVRQLLHDAPHRLTLRQRRAVQFTLLSAALMLAAGAGVVLMPESPLLSVTGHYEGSPLQHNLAALLLLLLFALSLIYGMLSGRFTSVPDALASSVQLLSRMSYCFAGILAAAQLVCLVGFVFPLEGTLSCLTPLLGGALYGCPLLLEFLAGRKGGAR